MMYKSATSVDNRDAGQMYEYLEARIDVLKRRVAELEEENQTLRYHISSDISVSTAGTAAEAFQA